MPSNTSLEHDLLRSIPRNHNLGSDDILGAIANLYPEVFAFDLQLIEGFNLLQHTQMVMGQFDKYFFEETLYDDFTPSMFRFLLALHDIGKPKAILGGDVTRQHQESLIYVDDIFKSLYLPSKQLKITRSIIGADTIGLYLQFPEEDPGAKKVAARIRSLAKKSETDLEVFYDLLLKYYISDSSSYTSDAGSSLGILDFLYNFDRGTISFADETQAKIDILEKEVFS